MTKSSQPEQFFLSSGIPVILQDYDASVAATYWWVKTGSADEAPGEEGFAHFLEHMLFKDASAKETGQASTGRLARTVESLGGDINAYTSFDQTVYHVTCAEHHWEKIFDAFGAMAKPQKFLRQDFEREREVILEELRKNEDSPDRQLFQALFSATFSKHPYGRPVIGFEKILKKAKVDRLEKFYRRNYVAQQMGLILVGPVGPSHGPRRKTLVRLLEKYFGSSVFSARKRGSPESATEKGKTRPEESELRSHPRLVIKPFDVTTPTLTVSFRVPALDHSDIPALDLISGILSAGELSRFYQRLFYKDSIVTDVSGGLYVPRDPGMLYFQAEMTDLEKAKPVFEAITEEIRRLIQDGPTSEELDRMVVNAESERLYATQTADGLASRLGFLKFILGDLEYDRHYLEELKRVDGARVQQIAAKYFDPRRMSSVLLLPKDQKNFDFKAIVVPAIAKLSSDVQESGRSEKKIKAKLKEKPNLGSGAEFFVRPSGLRVIHRERGSSPVMSMHVAALGGVRLEPIWGSSHLMSLTWTKGAGEKNARAIASIVEGSAAGFDEFSGRNAIGAQLTGLSRDWPKLSALFSEVLVGATFPEEEVTHSRRVALDSIRAIEDHSAQLCSKLFLETLFDQHPYGKFTTGSLDTLPEINSEKLRTFHRSWVRPEKLVLSVVGSVSRAQVEAWLGELEEKLFASVASSDFLLRELPKDESKLPASRSVERLMGREQLHIVVGGLGTKVSFPDRHALRLLQTILGGQSGRLFVELREKKSLGYTVSPLSFEGIERGYVGTYIACAPAKRSEAIAGIRHVLETLAERGPKTEEMKRAKEFFLGRRAMELQSDSALASHYGLQALYGITLKDDAALADRIRSVTAQDIREVCHKYFVEPHQVTSVVG